MSMTVLDTDPTPPAPEVSAAKRLQRLNRALLVQLVGDFQLVFARLWKDPNIAPQAIFGQFGADGQHLLDTLQARLDCISAIAVANGQVLNDYIASADRTPPAYTVSSGTVTVT